MRPVPNFPEQPPPGLTKAIYDAGLSLTCIGGVWSSYEPEVVETLAAAYVPLPHVLAVKEAELAHARWQRETGGFMFQPVGEKTAHRFVSTREAMGPVMGALLAAQAGVFLDPTLWKTADGNFVRLTAADVVPMFKAFVAHVAASFADEAAKQSQARKEDDWIKVDAIAIEAAVAVVR